MTALALARFADEGAFVRARLRAIAGERRIAGEWTPYASAALAGEDGAHGIVAAAVIAGVLGAAALFAVQAYSAGVAYAFDVGGRPPFSWPAFVPSAVEVGALIGGAAAVLVFAWRAALTRLHHPAFDLEEVREAMQGDFVLAVACDAGEDANALLAMLATSGATHTRVITP